MILILVAAMCMNGLTGGSPAWSQQVKPGLVVGVDANYAEGMLQEQNATWTWDGESKDLFPAMHRQGVDAFRVRLWVGEEGRHGTAAAARVVKRALDAGIDPYLVIFLSDDWADLMKQPVPSAWKDLSFDERLTAVQAYSQAVVQRLRAEGLQNHLYEIGNEIDYGICGEYPGKSSKKNPETLSRNIWPRTAKLILASQAGVRAADPHAKFMLHIAHWWDVDFCQAFFKFMLDQGVQLDYAGLSYFPTANIGGSLEIHEFARAARSIARAIDRPIIVPETAYPSTHDFKGQFSRWKYEAPGYPLSTEGQRRWIADFLSMSADHPDIHAVYYWSPEWFGEGMWKGFALFDPQGHAREGWLAFDRTNRFGSYLPDDIVLEIRGHELFRVPVEAARTSMTQRVAELRQQTGGVNVEHIARLSSTPLRVESYEIELRASLSNNMHLSLATDARGLDLNRPSDVVGREIDALIGDADTQRHRIVLMGRGEMPGHAGPIVDQLRSRGLRVDLHPLPKGKPMKFGMSGRFRDGESDSAP